MFKLATKTPLVPILENDTRWGSTYTMLSRYIELYEILPTCGFKTATRNMLLSHAEHAKILELHGALEVLQIATKDLQSADAHANNMVRARAIFDVLIERYPSMNTHRSTNAAVVHDRHFENGIVKIQAGVEDKLTEDEKRAVKVFKIGCQ